MAQASSEATVVRLPPDVDLHARPAGQVTRANGGLYYMFPAEFDEAADYLLTRTAEREALGRQGLAYVEREYRWPTVLSRVESLLAEVSRGVRPAK